MKVKILAIAVLLMLAYYVGGGLNQSSPQKITSVSEFVGGLKLGANFYDISFKAAQDTTTYQGLISKLGEWNAKKLLEKHLRVSTQQRQEEWDNNLTKSYLRHFSEDELISIANERDDSPFLEKFNEKKPSVGRSMQTMSEQLLKDNLREALEKALAETS